MRPLVLVQMAWADIQAPFGLPAAAHETPCRNAHRALNVERPSLDGTEPKEERIRGHGGGRGPAAANVLRLQKSRKAQQPVKAAVGQASGQLSGFSNHERPKGLEQSKRSKTKSTGAAF
jgi:hypothetical protein